MKNLINLTTLVRWYFGWLVPFVITQYNSGMKLWSVPSISVLLWKDQDTRKRKALIEPTYNVPFSGWGQRDMLKEHKRLRMPFSFIPNCSRFVAILSPYDWVMALFGFAIRGKGSTVQIRSWRAGKANKYLFSEFLLLKHLNDQRKMEEYWKIAYRLMSSNAYIVASFNHVLSGWEKDLSVKQVNKILKNVKAMVESSASEIDYKRVYIPKASGKLRPLGVPTKEWRVYLHMLNNLIVWTRIGKEGSQHGYFPGRGVHTAWKEVLDNKDRYRYVYEFDLSNFFEEVDLLSVNWELSETLGYPSHVVALLDKLNKSVVKLTDQDKIEEPSRKILLNSSGSFSPNASSEHKGLVPRIMRIGPDYVLPWNLKGDYELFKTKGVPQGAPISCSLSTLSIDRITNPERLKLELVHKDTAVVMYADDGIIFSNDLEAIEEIKRLFALQGVPVKEEKSKWLKKDGEWIDDIKFLGIRYSPREGRIYAETRNGATLEFTIKEQFLAYILKYRESILDPRAICYGGSASSLNSLESYEGISSKNWVYSLGSTFLTFNDPVKLLFQGRWSGFFLSGLYCDSWVNNRPADTRLTAANKYCWIKTQWPGYRFKTLSNKNFAVSLLRGALNRKVDEVFTKDIYREGFVWKKIVNEKVTDVKSLIQLYEETYEEKMKTLAPIEIGSSTYELPKVKEKVVKEIKALVLAWEYYEELIKDFSVATERENRQHSEILAKELKLDIYNSSTFACHDLLSNNLALDLKPLIMYKDPSIRLEPKDKRKEEWEANLPDLYKGLSRRIQREFKKNFLTNPLAILGAVIRNERLSPAMNVPSRKEPERKIVLQEIEHEFVHLSEENFLNGFWKEWTRLNSTTPNEIWTVRRAFLLLLHTIGWRK